MIKPNSLCPTKCPLCEYRLLRKEWGLLAYHVFFKHTPAFPSVCPCGFVADVNKRDYMRAAERALTCHLANQRDLVEHLTLAAISRVGE